MKKNWIFGSIIAFLAVLFAFAQVFASPASFDPKGTPNHDIFVTLTPTGTPSSEIAPNVNHEGNPQGVTPPAINMTSVPQDDNPQGNNGNPQGDPHGNPQGHDKSHGKHANYRGSLSLVSATSLTIKAEDGSMVTFVLTSDTRIHIPGMGRDAAYTYIQAGARLAVHAEEGQDGVLNARKVMVIPGKPILMHRLGLASSYTPGVSLTIKTPDGSTFTFAVTADTQILPTDPSSPLAVGSLVTVVMPRDVTGGPATARAIVIHPAQ